MNVTLKIENEVKEIGSMSDADVKKLIYCAEIFGYMLGYDVTLDYKETKKQSIESVNKVTKNE